MQEVKRLSTRISQLEQLNDPNLNLIKRVASYLEDTENKLCATHVMAIKSFLLSRNDNCIEEELAQGLDELYHCIKKRLTKKHSLEPLHLDSESLIGLGCKPLNLLTELRDVHSDFRQEMKMKVPNKMAESDKEFK